MYSFQLANILPLNKVTLFIIAFCLGGGVSYLFFNFNNFFSNAKNTEIVAEIPEVPLIQEEKPANLVYRNLIFGLVFLYPSDAYAEIKENPFGKFGKDLGVNIPYQEITLASDGNVSLKIWNKSQLNRILQENKGVTVFNSATFSEEMIQQLPKDEKQFIFQSGEFLIQGSVDITRVSKSELGDVFINSFRLLNHTGPVVTTRWQTHRAEKFALLYPNDWFVEPDSNKIRMYTATELEEEEYSKRVRSFGLLTYETMNLEYFEGDFTTWVETQIPRVNALQEEYIKLQEVIPLRENIFHNVELCNVGGEYYKGFVLERGTMCRSLYALTPKSSTGMLRIYNIEDPLADPTTKAILQNITFK